MLPRDHCTLLALRSMIALALAVLAGGSAAHGQAAPPPLKTYPHTQLHTDTLWSQSLGIRKALTVYLPPSYSSSPTRRYPVLVYLHGLTGNERNWAEQGRLAQTFDSLARAGKPEAIVVMPDGDDGWYTTWNQLNDMTACRADTARKERADTYCVPWPHYDEYIARDIVTHVDRHYRTRATRASRAIAGLSMGGYGAIALALAYPDVFGAAASHSGVLSPRYLGPKPFAPPPAYAVDSMGLRTSAGWLWKWMAPAFGRDSIGWVARDPGRMATRALKRARRIPALMLDCGADDPFIDQNRDFHNTLTRLGIVHRYAEWPGKHDWDYWRTHAAESATFLLEQTRAR